MPSAPGFVVNGFKREQLVAMNSMILHNVFFDGPGEESEPGSVLARLQKLMDESVPPLRRLLGADRIGNSMRATAHGAPPPAAVSASPAADLKPGASVL